jgi:hypothetical protein
LREEFAFLGRNVMRIWIAAAIAGFAFASVSQAATAEPSQSGAPKPVHPKVCRTPEGRKILCPHSSATPSSTPQSSAAVAAPVARFTPMERTAAQTIPPKNNTTTTTTNSSAPATPH